MKNKILLLLLSITTLIFSELHEIRTVNPTPNNGVIERVFYFDNNNPPTNTQRYFNLRFRIVQTVSDNYNYSYKFYKDINDKNNVTEEGDIESTGSDYLDIEENIYFENPGLYICLLELEGNAGEKLNKIIRINNYLPYLAEPIVAVHGWYNEKDIWDNDEYKNFFKYLRGTWNTDNDRYEGGYDLVTVANTYNYLNGIEE